MKRSALPRPDPEKVRAWLNKPRKPIARVGRKTLREKDALDAARTVVRARRGCELAGVLGPDGRPVCAVATHYGQDVHHLSHADRDRGIHDPARMMYLCRVSHERVESEPAWAYENGYLIRDRTTR